MKEKGLSGRKQAIIQLLLRYLIEHLDAKDTLEGILEWWLLKDYARQREEVKDALNFLFSREWLTKRETHDYRILYGINQERREEINAFLDSLERKTKENGDLDYQE